MLPILLNISADLIKVLKITGIGYVTIFVVILLIMGVVALLNMLNKFSDKEEK